MRSLIAADLGLEEVGRRTGVDGSRTGSGSGGIGVLEQESRLFALFSVAGEALVDRVPER